MNGKTHSTVGGMTAGLLVAHALSKGDLAFEFNNITVHTLVAIYPAMVGGILPDMDMPNSRSGRYVRKFLNISITGSAAILAVLGILSIIRKSISGLLLPTIIYLTLTSILSVTLKTFSHRKQTHYGIVALLLFLPFLWCSQKATGHILYDIFGSGLLGFWLGWLSHIIADSFNKKGVPWLFPFSSKHYHIATVKTGTKEEEVFRYISIGFFVVVYTVILVVGSGVHAQIANENNQLLYFCYNLV